MKKNTITICLLAAVASVLLPSCMVSGGGYGPKGGMAYGVSSPVQLGFAVQLNNQQQMAGGYGGGGCAPQRACPPQGYGRPQGPPPGYRPQRPPSRDCYGNFDRDYRPSGFAHEGRYDRQRQDCRSRPPRREYPPQYGGYDPRVRQPAPGGRNPYGNSGGRRGNPYAVNVYGHSFSDDNPSGYRGR